MAPAKTVAALLLLAIASVAADAAVVEHTFHVANLTISRPCQSRVVTAVNSTLPGPTVDLAEGDTLAVHVINDSPYNLSIHWHGIFQKLSGWADGASMITQCPIRPGNNYTYRFNVTGQEGTLWWHAHTSFLRATVYGALIIRPRNGSFPFSPQPDHHVPLLLGEWWNANVVEVENQALLTGSMPSVSDAFTINGLPGDLYRCSTNETIYNLQVVAGDTYLLRIINAALNHQLFFKIAGHNFTVVAADAGYTNPYPTDVIVVAPGQTIDALMLANATPASYYIAARAYASAAQPFDTTITTGILTYAGAAANDSSPPLMPTLPPFNDTPTAHQFYTNLTALSRPDAPAVPLQVDEHMFVTFGLGRAACEPTQLLCNPSSGALAASMNNVSFQFPTSTPLLQARFSNVTRVYTSDFPDQPPVLFDFTNATASSDPALLFTEKGTRLRKVKFNSTVELVLQNTAILGVENHPLHLHGFNFFVLAQGFGNYNATAAVSGYNLVNPQVRNTIGVPMGGWAVIRFVTDNPGVWMFHCHLDVHLPMGLGMAFEVEDGPTPDSVLPPPPADLPTC